LRVSLTRPLWQTRRFPVHPTRRRRIQAFRSFHPLVVNLWRSCPRPVHIVASPTPHSLTRCATCSRAQSKSARWSPIRGRLADYLRLELRWFRSPNSASSNTKLPSKARLNPLSPTRRDATRSSAVHPLG